MDSEKRLAGTVSLSDIEPPSELPSFVSITSPNSSQTNEMPKNDVSNTESQVTVLNQAAIQMNMNTDNSGHTVLIPVLQHDVHSPQSEYFQPKFSPAISSSSSSPPPPPQLSSSQQPHTNANSSESADDSQKKESENNNWSGQAIIGWMKDAVTTNPILTKVAEKARSSVDTVLTTLDPQLKDLMGSENEVELLVTTCDEIKLNAIREAFQSVFSKVVISAIQNDQIKIAPQLVGFAAAFKGAKERIDSVLHGNRLRKPVIAIENFLLELENDKWFDVSFIQLYDVTNNINMEIFTQAISIPVEIIAHLKAETSTDYELKATGFSLTVGQIFNQNFGTTNDDWYQVISGISQREVLITSIKSIAKIYKKKLNIK